jgi:DNA-binding XRE family transcriptional regulator
MDAKWFAGRLRELRRQADLTQQQLGEKAGLTRDGIAQIETGKNSPSWETVVAICRALGVDCTEFAKEPTIEPSGPGRPKRSDDGPPAGKVETVPKKKPADTRRGDAK